MASDDLTQDLPDKDRITQPMIEQLVEEVRAMRAELGKMETRIAQDFQAELGKMETKIAQEFHEVNARIQETGTALHKAMQELRDTMDALNRRSLNTDRDYSRLLNRIEELEGSKAS